MNNFDIWVLFDTIVSDWKVLATIGTILSLIVGIMIRFNTIEQKVLGTDNTKKTKKWYQRSSKSELDCKGPDSCLELREFIESKFDVLHDRIEVLEGSIEEISRQQDKDNMEQGIRINKLEELITLAEISREEAAVRTRLILRGVTASLEGLLEQGCNGPVKNALTELDEYRDKRASQ